MLLEHRQYTRFVFSVELSGKEIRTLSQAFKIRFVIIAWPQLYVAVGNPIDHSQIVIHDNPMVSGVHHHRLKEGLVRNETVAIEIFEPLGLGIMADIFAEGARDCFPLRPNEGRITPHIRSRYARRGHFAMFFKEHMADPVQCVGAFLGLVEGANKLPAGIFNEKLMNVILGLEREILP